MDLAIFCISAKVIFLMFVKEYMVSLRHSVGIVSVFMNSVS